jgi:hypothetical protein
MMGGRHRHHFWVVFKRPLGFNLHRLEKCQQGGGLQSVRVTA